MNSVFLKDLFNTLEKNKVNYLVLRGYQDLPKKYSHDIDFSVINENELTSFFNVLHNLSKKYNFRISRDVVRLGLLKVFLHFGNEILKIDIFCSFSYGGLEYINIDDLHNSKRKSPSNISIPSLNYELAISLLKEILHNSRIRKDKIGLLRTQYNKTTFYQPFIKYFSKINIENISTSLFSNDKLIFRKVAFSCRFNLFFMNIKLKGLFYVLHNMMNFALIMYYNKSKYDKIIINKI